MKDVLALIERHQRLAKMLEDGREITFKNERHYSLFAESADVLERLYRALMREHGENEAAAEITRLTQEVERLTLELDTQRDITDREFARAEAERERCARIAETYMLDQRRSRKGDEWTAAEGIAAAIRKG